MAQIIGDGTRGYNFLRVQSGERVAMHWNSIVRGDCEGGDGIGKDAARMKRLIREFGYCPGW